MESGFSPEQRAALDRMIQATATLSQRLTELRDKHEGASREQSRRLFAEVSTAYFRARAAWNEGWTTAFGAERV